MPSRATGLPRVTTSAPWDPAPQRACPHPGRQAECKQPNAIGRNQQPPGARQGLLEAVLRFCYSGECLVARGSVLALLLLADRFAVPALQAACEEARCVQQCGQSAEQAHVALTSSVQGMMHTVQGLGFIPHPLPSLIPWVPFVTFASKQHAQAGPASTHLLKLAPCKPVACAGWSGEGMRLPLSLCMAR